MYGCVQGCVVLLPFVTATMTDLLERAHDCPALNPCSYVSGCRGYDNGWQDCCAS